MKTFSKKSKIEFVPLALLSLMGIYSIFQVLTTDYVFNAKQYIGLTLLFVSNILFYSNRRIYKYIFGATLLLALFNLIGFTTSLITLEILISIQLIIVPFVIFYTWIYKEQLKPKIQSILGTTEDQINSDTNSKISGFKRRFEKLSNEEIERKLSQNLVDEAHEALKQIKNQRNI